MQSFEKKTYDRYSLINVLKCTIIIILWYLLFSSFEIIVESTVSNAEKLIGSFSYLIFEWTLDSIVTLCIIFVLSKKYVQGVINFGWQIYRKDFIFLLCTIICGFFLTHINNIIYNLSILYLPENFPAHEIASILNNYSAINQLILLYLHIIIITPIVEEFFMRGLCYKILRKKYSITFSIIITNVIFILFHPVVAWIPHFILINISLCIIYEKTNKIYYPILLHASLNLFALIFNFN